MPWTIENGVSTHRAWLPQEPETALRWELLRSLGFREGVAVHHTPLTGLLLAFGLGSLASGIVLSQEQFAQDVQIATQDAQANVTLVAPLALVATTLLAIAGLEGTDRRFHPGVLLPGLAEFHGRFLLLLPATGAFVAGNSQALIDADQ